MAYEPEGEGSLSRFFFDRTAKILGREAGLEDFEEFARLPLAAGFAKERPPYAVVHPGSGSLDRRWPLDRFLKIIRRLNGRGVSGIVVTGEAEELPAEDLERAGLPSGWDSIRRPPLGELARALAGAALYIGNDSGVTHLAAACGTPVLALFQDKHLAAWRPFGRTRVVSGPDVSEIGVEDVWETAGSILGLP